MHMTNACEISAACCTWCNLGPAPCPLLPLLKELPIFIAPLCMLSEGAQRAAVLMLTANVVALASRLHALSALPVSLPSSRASESPLCSWRRLWYMRTTSTGHDLRNGGLLEARYVWLCSNEVAGLANHCCMCTTVPQDDFHAGVPGRSLHKWIYLAHTCWLAAFVCSGQWPWYRQACGGEGNT